MFKINRVTEPNSCRARILNDTFLKNCYSENYKFMISHFLNESESVLTWETINLLCRDKSILEIGSAGGILNTLLKNVITTDVRESEGVDRYLDAQKMEISTNSVDLVLGKDTLHHLPNVEDHFCEIDRILKPGGKAIYLEPNWNLVSRIVFKYLHPEDWSTKSVNWSFHSKDPMESNQALAHNIFVRDAVKFEKLFPNLCVSISEKPVNGLSYLISGGVNLRLPISSNFLVRMSEFERRSLLWMKALGFNRVILIEKR